MLGGTAWGTSDYMKYIVMSRGYMMYVCPSVVMSCAHISINESQLHNQVGSCDTACLICDQVV